MYKDIKRLLEKPRFRINMQIPLNYVTYICGLPDCIFRKYTSKSSFRAVS